MNVFEAMLLGLVQGLAEFLPISSSGHLVLIRELLGINGEGFLFFDVMLHAGTLLSIFVVFFKDLLKLFKPPFKTIGLIALASIPAVIAALLFEDKIGALFADGKYLCFFFLFTAAIMFAAELIGKRVKEPKSLGLKTAIAMGIMQGVAVFPGISRSGSTLFGGIVTKSKREEIAKFSFFMSIPVILGSIVFTAVKIDTFAAVPWYSVAAGMAVSFVAGLFAIKLMLKVIAKANYKWFSLYLVAISIISFIFIFL